MDLAIVESHNGGELIKKGNDLFMIPGWSNMVYLALFGGNVEAVTRTRKPGEQDFSWWGNATVMTNDESIQFNSRTEKALKNTPLTSAGRIVIQQAVEKDVEFMKAFATIKVTVVIIDTFKVKIIVNVIQPASPDGKVPDQARAFIWIWDGMTQTLDGDFDFDDFNDDFFL